MIRIPVFFILFTQVLCHHDCGEPGRSVVAYPIPSRLFYNKTYPSGHVFKYECREPYQTMDFYKRQCVNGEWNTPIPRCGTEYDGEFTIKITNSSGKDIVKIFWNEPLPMEYLMFELRLNLSKTMWVEADQTKNFKGFQTVKAAEFTEIGDNGLYSLYLSRSEYKKDESPITASFRTTFFQFTFKTLTGIHVCADDNDKNCIVRELTILRYNEDQVNHCETADAMEHMKLSLVVKDDRKIATYSCPTGTVGEPSMSTCLTDNYWTQISKPNCVKQCDLTDVRYSLPYYSLNPLVTAGQVHMRCLSGQWMTLKCMDSGEWEIKNGDGCDETPINKWMIASIVGFLFMLLLMIIVGFVLKFIWRRSLEQQQADEYFGQKMRRPSAPKIEPLCDDRGTYIEVQCTRDTAYEAPPDFCSREDLTYADCKM